MSKSGDKKHEASGSLLASLIELTGQVAGNTLDIARNTATMTAMFGENWLRDALTSSLEPERREAMAEAGRFMRDARETAGLSLKDLAETLGVSDNSVLEDVERGASILPLELMLRSAALLARHDPIPFLIKFMRTYNPALEKKLEQWGALTLPKLYERERRLINIYRQHDVLRNFSDEEHNRFVEYISRSTELVLSVMLNEKAANAPDAAGPGENTRAKPASGVKAKAGKKTTRKKKVAAKRNTPHKKPVKSTAKSETS